MELVEMLESPPAVVTRQWIMELQRVAEGLDPGQFPRLDCPLVHRFVPGIYAREIFMPAGTFAVGKIHLHDHISTILGDVSFASTIEGVRRVTGMETFTSSAGVKRAAFCHADTWWTTFHPNPTNTRDLAELERLLIAPDFDALDFAKGIVQ